jgi:hypothetical protein
MENLSPVSYTTSDVKDVETDVGFTLKQTINQGLNDGGVLSFVIPADPERFTDLNTILLRLELGVRKANGTALDATDEVFIDGGGMHSLFSSCDVRFNGEVVSSMTAYPYTTALSRYLGSTQDARMNIWDAMDGSWDWARRGKSDLREAAGLLPAALVPVKARVGNQSVVIGRVYSDVLMSSRQYLPPGVTLGIDLRRGPEHFALCGIAAGGNFKVVIQSASLYVKRLHLAPAITSKVNEVLRDGGGCLTYNRLETRILSIPQGSQVFRWLNCLNNAPLPNRIYVGFVAQTSLYGQLTQASTYFENLNMASLSVKLNGRDILVEPIKTRFSKTNGSTVAASSDGRAGFLTLIEAMNQVTDQTAPMRLNYLNYMYGTTIFAVELGKCGEKSGSSGALDLEFTFAGTGTDAEGAILLFTEKTECARVSPSAAI